MRESTLHTFQTVAKVLIAEHLGRKWKFRWHNGLSSYGICDFDNKVISMSKPLTMAGTLREAKDTLMHEVIHGMTPDEPGHGPEWRELCVRMGVNPIKGKWETTIEKLRKKVLCAKKRRVKNKRRNK